MCSGAFIGIDAGGSSTVLRAVIDGSLAFERVSGPANATSTPPELFERHLLELSEGCPEPVRVAGCFAGLSNRRALRLAADVLGRCFPAAELRLAPDYLAAVLASSGSADVVVIAGTGSVCVSDVDGTVASSGGLGFLVGDRGSGFRYGQAFLEHSLLQDPDQLDEVARAALLDAFGTLNRSDLVQLIHADPSPAELLAGFAPALVSTADRGEDWALGVVDRETASLATLVALHIDTHVADRADLRVDLAGGVWMGDAVRHVFTRHLRTNLPGRRLDIRTAVDPPVVGAVRLASLSHDSFQRYVTQGRAIEGLRRAD